MIILNSIHGGSLSVCIMTGQRSQDTDAKVIEMANKYMYLKIDIKRDEISRSHRVGPKKPQGSPRPIIVKFVTHRYKSRLYKARGSLKMGGTETANLFISEYLMKKRTVYVR